MAGIAGGALGAYISTVKQNFVQFTGGKKHPSVYRAPLKPVSDPKAQAQTYVVYFSGAGQHGNINDYQHAVDRAKPESDKIIVAGWDQAQQMIPQIQGLRPQDKVIVVGHSAGGAEAIRFAQKVGRPIQKLITLDPVQLNPATRLKYALFGVKMPQYVKTWQNHLPRNTKETTASNVWTKYNPGVLGQIKTNMKDGTFRNTFWNSDHSLIISGLRMPSNVPGVKQLYYKALTTPQQDITFMNPFNGGATQNYLKGFLKFIARTQTPQGLQMLRKFKNHIRFHLPPGLEIPGTEQAINGVDYATYMKRVREFNPYAKSPMLNPFLHMTYDTLRNLFGDNYGKMRRNYVTMQPLYPNQIEDYKQ